MRELRIIAEIREKGTKNGTIKVRRSESEIKHNCSKKRGALKGTIRTRPESSSIPSPEEESRLDRNVTL